MKVVVVAWWLRIVGIGWLEFFEGVVGGGCVVLPDDGSPFMDCCWGPVDVFEGAVRWTIRLLTGFATNGFVELSAIGVLRVNFPEEPASCCV